MDTATHQILEHMAVVDRLRSERAADANLAKKVNALKAYQARRFEVTYRDLLSVGQYRDAALFFLQELYGSREFSQRDAQFARIVPSIVRLLPKEVVATVSALTWLHALSEELDSRMGRLMPNSSVSARSYVRAWQLCGHFEQRRQQIALTLRVGRALNRYTRNPWLLRVLKLMRAPAAKAGLEELQRFLERGFVTFGRMTNAHLFLKIIDQRETKLATALCSPAAILSGHTAPMMPELDQLP